MTFKKALKEKVGLMSGGMLSLLLPWFHSTLNWEQRPVAAVQVDVLKRCPDVRMVPEPTPPLGQWPWSPWADPRLCTVSPLW